MSKFKESELLGAKIKDTQRYIKILELSVSDSFNEREISVNIYGSNDDRYGYAHVPKSVMKSVCMIILHANREELKKLKNEFNELFK